MKQNLRAVRIQDVSKAAGISVTTVSRVLNGKDDVAPETVQRVQKVIKELGYVSSLAARGMRSRRINVIGLIIPDVSSPYCIEVLRGVNQAIARMDYDLLIYTTGDIRKYGVKDQERRYVKLLNGSITDGVIVVTPAATNFSTDAPLVVIDPNNESPDSPAIIGTNRAGALAAMTYLTGLGHRRIGHISGRLELVSACDRLEGYKDGLAAAGIPLVEDLIQIGDYTTENAEECTRVFLRMKDPPTAIFAANDMSAMGVYHVARQAGVRIPQDLSVVGFDNLRESAFLTPPLTTVDQFITEMGAMATDIIVKMVNGDEQEKKLIKISTQLVVRDSCLPLAVNQETTSGEENIGSV
jgi:LacI family transcriptional regulator